MGVSINGTGSEEKITFSCDHPKCSAKTVRMVYPHWYCRQTGQTYARYRSIRNPVAYWVKVLQKPRRKNIAPFFLLGTSDDWPRGIRVFCEEHYTARKRIAIPQRPTSKLQEQEQRRMRYQERRRDIFG